MATYNGAAFVEAQLRSILASRRVDEVVVSDDGSTDATLARIAGVDDPRVRVVAGPRAGLIRNFENALSQARGDVVFLSDQDDLWLPQKVDVVMRALDGADLIVTDCSVVDAGLRVVAPSFFALHGSGPGFARNLLRNSYLGCCMAFRRSVLERALPFPAALPMHDWWIGLVAERSGRVAFVDTPLTLYRRHGGNTSSASQPSVASLGTQLRWRLALVRALASRRLLMRRDRRSSGPGA
jgi:glycosyltransferase involved in cell wall biosynthesis